ncbi:hypothetical protein ABKN59_002148 [Abortiporus biennis]
MNVPGIVYPTGLGRARICCQLYGLFMMSCSLIAVYNFGGLLTFVQFGTAETPSQSTFRLTPSEEDRNTQMTKTFASSVGFTLGFLHFLYTGLLWERGGKAFVEYGIWSHIVLATMACLICLLNFGRYHLLLLIAMSEIGWYFATKRAADMSLKELIEGRIHAVSVVVNVKTKEL